MSAYKATIGMEIHAELKTATKMFCASRNDPDEQEPNVNVCPVCLAHPGTLPLINREAVKHVLRVGAATGGTLADYTEFDRKNYFYPDLPKGYQISQYEFPLVSGGMLDGVSITRIHLEEDTASSTHDEASHSTEIDFNRAGVPLMELVTDPVITSAEMAGSFARELQVLLRYLGVSDANMEKGQMRVEANISVSNNSKLGTKVEVKNLNSFRAMERAVAYEIKRQTALLEKGGTVVQETRGWDDAKQATFSQRIKEESADYRYFPDPDLPHLMLSEIAGLDTKSITSSLPELPSERRARFLGHGIKADDADAYVRDMSLGSYFDEIIHLAKGEKELIALASNYVANDLRNIISSLANSANERRDIDERETETKDFIRISASQFIKLMRLTIEGKLSSRGAKDILAEIANTGTGDVEETAVEKGLYQKGDKADLDPVIDKVMRENASAVLDYRNGKEASLEYLVGQCMKLLGGAGNPKTLREVLRSKLV